ncbi:aldose 1-epimerase [Asticcacaulis biprosthecium C19]|uniref:Aldose 1-epimerase n=1 Tax=Asticcacaulis biprosthecium C19 TaxID=715226 RepID=F4QNL4_9CAUL|nr:aldose epimerase family protein [Asticcacaulis biprosthecium]EGF90922.1 aldose 1-epimerase [Asticcacaulis biprosthecium C19]
MMSMVKRLGLAVSLGAIMCLSACADKGADASKTAAAVSATRADWGALSDGAKVEAVELKNSKGVSARIITYGATLQNLIVPDKAGLPGDIVIGYDNIEGYEKTPNYTGVTVGRYANRIAKGKFTIDGKEYTLAINNTPNALHGGLKGWDKRNWTITDVKSGDTASVTLQYVSPDGEEGYPGTVTAEVTYSLNENNDLTVSYKATTDKPTVVNMTNHSLFNLGGVPVTRSALDAYVKIESDAILAVDKTLIPTGELKVAGTPFDFNTPGLISERVTSTHPQIVIGNAGIDHNYIIRGGLTAAPKPAVTIEDKTSGRAMTIATTEPGIQMYTGNFLDGTIAGKGGQKLVKYQAVAFEAQRYPDSPNQASFPTTRLDPGQTYTQTTVHHFYTVQ